MRGWAAISSAQALRIALGSIGVVAGSLAGAQGLMGAQGMGSGTSGPAGSGAPTSLLSSGSPPLTGQGIPGSLEAVPKLGESHMTWLDELRRRRREALAAPADPLFQARVRAAVVQHPEVRSAVVGVDGAVAGTAEARSAFKPQIAGQSEGGWRFFDRNALLNTPERSYTTGGLGMSLRQLVYDFGAAAALVESSEARERVAAARMEAKRAELVLRAIQAAVELDRTRRQLELARENDVARIAIAQYVKERYDLGGGSVSDVLRAESRIAESRAAIVSAQTRLEAAEAGYREIFGVVPADIPLGVDAPIDVPGVSQVNELAPSFPTVRAAVAVREAAVADSRAISSRAMPQINFEASLNRRDLVGSVASSPGTDRTAGLTMRYDFYTGGAATAREAQAVARLRQAEEDLRGTIQSFERFAQEILADVRASTQLVSARIQAVDLAAQSLRAVREQFAFRRGTLLDLLTAHEAVNSAGQALIDAYAQQVLGSYRLLYVSSRLDAYFGMTGN